MSGEKQEKRGLHISVSILLSRNRMRGAMAQWKGRSFINF